MEIVQAKITIGYMNVKKRAINMEVAAIEGNCAAESIPASRLRNIGPFDQVRVSKMTRQALIVLTGDANLAPLARRCASQLLQGFPDENQLASLDSDQASLAAWNQPMLGARALFQVLAMWQQGTESTGKLLEATLHCYPDSVTLGADDPGLAALCHLLAQKPQSSESSQSREGGFDE